MIERKSGSWVIKAKRMKLHSRDDVALKIASEGRFVVELLKKTQASPEVLDKISMMSELSVKAKTASFLEKYRSKPTSKAA